MMHVDSSFQVDFTGALFLTLTGREARIQEKKVFDLVLVFCMHQAPQLGLLEEVRISEVMVNFHKIKASTDMEKTCLDLIHSYQGKVIPGFVLKDDMSTAINQQLKTLLTQATKAGVSRDYITLTEILTETIEWKLKKIVMLNVEGVIAVLLLSVGLQPRVGNSLFQVAQLAGSISSEEVKPSILY